MNEQIAEIKSDIQAAIDKLDAFKAGKGVERAFLIERLQKGLFDFVRYDISELENFRSK